MSAATPTAVRTSSTLLADVSALLFLEARCLDDRLWDEWLALFTEDTVFWMPAWKSETGMTDDPDTELSLIYYEGRDRLEERIWRIRSNQSPASLPLPRTAHAITNISIVSDDDDAVVVRSNWTVNQYNPKRKAHVTLFGSYEHSLSESDGRWMIRRKKIVLMNDYIGTIIDVYSI